MRGKIFFLLIPFLFIPFSLKENYVEASAYTVDVLAKNELETLDTADKYKAFWNAEIRPTADASICDISIFTFEYAYNQYQVMPSGEKDILNDWEDKAGAKVKDTLLYLNAHFHPLVASTSSKNVLERDTTITIIVATAFFGMTSIGLFFVLKNKKVID